MAAAGWVLGACLRLGGTILRKPRPVSIAPSAAGSHVPFSRHRPPSSPHWLDFCGERHLCIQIWRALACSTVTLLLQLQNKHKGRCSQGQRVTPRVLCFNRGWERVRFDLLSCLTVPPALLQYVPIPENRTVLRAPDLPCWLEQEEFWHHSQAFGLGCSHRTVSLGTFLCGCSAAGPEISPSPVAAQVTCPSAALSFPRGTDGVCLVLEGGSDLLGVLGLMLPAWLCARCMWADLSC